MKIQKYLKNYFEEEKVEALCIEMSKSKVFKAFFADRRKILAGIFLLLILPLLLSLVHFSKSTSFITDENFMNFGVNPIASVASKTGVISIPSGMVKANPFLPYRDIGDSNIVDVPEISLVEPPSEVTENSEAARVMDTIVSGILYDKYSPSAILNIEGNDYLVKKGDSVNGYKVLNITQHSVTVRLGSNVYTAGIGEILTEGSIQKNNVSNLNNKFGGRKL